MNHSASIKYKAVILIGGLSKGTRFRPLSLDLPKPFFPVAGQPILSQHIRSLVQLGNVSEVLLMGFYDESFLAYNIKSASREFDIPVSYLREPEALGTAGGLYHFRERILQGDPDHVIVMHGDICCNFPLKQIVNFHLSHGGRGKQQKKLQQKQEKELTIVGTVVPEEKTHHYGCIVQGNTTSTTPPTTHSGKRCQDGNDDGNDDRDNGDDETIGGPVVHYAEKPETVISNLINCGIYVMKSSLIHDFPSIRKSTSSQSSGGGGSGDDDDDCNRERSVLGSLVNPQVNTSSNDHQSKISHLSLERDVFTYLAGSGRMFVYRLQQGDFWGQIKSPRAAIESSQLYMKYFKQQSPELLATQETVGCRVIGEVVIDSTAQIDPSAKIGPNVTIGKNVVIGPGVRISNSIILDSVEIQENTLVSYSIIGWTSTIGKWCRIEGSPTDKTNQQHDNRENITILGSGVTVNHELVVRNSIVLQHRELCESVSDRILL